MNDFTKSPANEYYNDELNKIIPRDLINENFIDFLLVQLAERDDQSRTKRGAGSKLNIKEDKIRDERIKSGENEKWGHNQKHSDGSVTEIHYNKDVKTGKSSDFKFKDAPNNNKSRIYLPRN